VSTLIPAPIAKEDRMSSPHDLISVATAAKALGITPDALRGAIKRKVLSPVRVDGRTNMLTREEVEKYRREHLGQQGKRAQPDDLTEQQRKQRAYQAAYYQRKKAARQQQPAEPAE
jgi:excisionase family DNA binding protein